MNKDEIKHPLNVAGDYSCTYIDNEVNNACIICGLCPSTLPEVFNEDDEGFAYVHKQPSLEYELEIANELINDCPVGSIVKL
ncbi:MAG: ferredoxin [Lentisphaeraceae bacterium]|nr:ferredoxin [Lentisphaeraceae bacterium]